MSEPRSPRDQLGTFVRDSFLPTTHLASELLQQLCSDLCSTRDLASESLAKLIRSSVIKWPDDVLTDLMSIFGVPEGWLTRMAWVPKPHPRSGDNEFRQQLLGQALGAHRRVVAWIYQVGLILDCDFSSHEDYKKWREREDDFEDTLAAICRDDEMHVLASLNRPTSVG